MAINYAKLFNRRITPQSQPVPGSTQVPNSAGGFSWVVDDWTRLDRFLILGADGGTYYIAERDLVKQNHDALVRCIQADGVRAVNFAKVPKKRPKLCARTIRERDGNRCQYTGRLLHPDEGSLDHVLPRSRGGQDAWENLVWSAKDVNQRKADRLPHEAGLKLLRVPRAPKELPVTEFIRKSPRVADWELFLA